MGSLRKARRNIGVGKKGIGKKKSVVTRKVSEKESESLYSIPSEVWNNWNYETKFKVRGIIGDESLTHAECAAMIEKIVSDSVKSGNKKMEETLFPSLVK